MASFPAAELPSEYKPTIVFAYSSSLLSRKSNEFLKFTLLKHTLKISCLSNMVDSNLLLANRDVNTYPLLTSDFLCPYFYYRDQSSAHSAIYHPMTFIEFKIIYVALTHY